MNKKVLYIIIFIVAIVGVVGLVFFFNNATQNRDSKVNTIASGEKEQTNNNKETKVTVTELEDGTLYQIGEPIEKVDKVIGNNFYDTQINDIYLNFSQYEGKTIEIEGMYIKQTAYNGDPITLIGRYSTANVCQYCSQGYSSFEYEWKGDKTPRLISEVSWIKLKGTLKKGRYFLNGQFDFYYYIEVNSMEVMNERGMDTVNN